MSGISLPLLHDRRYCQCRWCEFVSRHATKFDVAWKGGLMAFIVYVAIHLLRWAFVVAPGLQRIGGM